MKNINGMIINVLEKAPSDPWQPSHPAESPASPPSVLALAVSCSKRYRSGRSVVGEEGRDMGGAQADTALVRVRQERNVRVL